MNFFYFVEKYFDELNDNKFQLSWKKHFHDNLGRSIWKIFFFWVVFVIGFGMLIIEVVGTFFGIILTVFFSGYFAYVVLIQFFKFLAKFNTRYIQGEVFSNKNTMNYEDVVETIKK